MVMVHRAALVAVVALLAFPADAEIVGKARVIDGDTIEIDGEHIRLHGIDAPEFKQTCTADGAVWPCGQWATAALVKFIGGAPVSCRARGEDQYGRIIAACTVRSEGIEAYMVRSGWALAYRRYSDDYVDEEAIAQAAQAGMWRGEFVPPWDWRRGARLGQSSASLDEAGPLSPGKVCTARNRIMVVESHQPN